MKAIRNNTQVRLPSGRVGRVVVTRRERELIDAGSLHEVGVLESNGLRSSYLISELTPVHDTPEYMRFGVCIHGTPAVELKLEDGSCTLTVLQDRFTKSDMVSVLDEVRDFIVNGGSDE